MKTGRLRIDVVYDETKTDLDAIACAADTLLETALSTPGILDEYANPTFEPFYVQYHDEKRGPVKDRSVCGWSADDVRAQAEQMEVELTDEQVDDVLDDLESMEESEMKDAWDIALDILSDLDLNA